jgi:hypothetical protein
MGIQWIVGCSMLLYLEGIVIRLKLIMGIQWMVGWTGGCLCPSPHLFYPLWIDWPRHLFRELDNRRPTSLVARKSDAWPGPIIFLLQKRANISDITSKWPASTGGYCINIKPHTFSEIVLEPAGQVTQMPHATSSCCLPPDGLHTPVVCSKAKKKREPKWKQLHPESASQHNQCNNSVKLQTAYFYQLQRGLPDTM